MLTSCLYFIPKYKLNGYWLSLLLADVISVIYTFTAINGFKYIRLNCKIPSYLKEMLLFSIPLIPNATMWWIINSINRPILISNIGIDGVGLYTIAGKFPSLISILFTIFFPVFQISVLEEYKNKNFNTFYTTIFKVILFLQILITLFFELFGSTIFDLFVDIHFHKAVYYLPIFCLGVVISNIACFVGVIFTATKETKYFLYSAILGAVVAVIANLLLIPRFGIMGACLSIVFSQTAMAIYRYIKSNRYVALVDSSPLLYSFLVYISSIIVYYCIESTLLRDVLICFCCIYLFVLNRRILHSTITVILGHLIGRK